LFERIVVYPKRKWCAIFFHLADYTRCMALDNI
jgi:hypothetical protein